MEKGTSGGKWTPGQHSEVFLKSPTSGQCGRQVPYRVGRDEEGNVQLLCDFVEGGVLYPEEVSAYVLAELLSAAEAFTETSIKKAVISVR